MKKLILYIQGEKVAEARLNIGFVSILKERMLIQNAIEKMKIENCLSLQEGEWEIFLTCKSKIDG